MPTLRAACFGLALASLASAQTAETLPPFAVNAHRSSLDPSRSATLVRTFAPAELQGGLALDDALRADPAFSLFRRTGSLAAHPTAQGVSLRGIGPSGASRTLVLLDGVPLNDPFGGWVLWNQVPALAIGAAEIARGGGAGAWGNAALGGTIALISAPVSTPGGSLVLEGGEHATFRGELTAAARRGATALRVDARAFTTDGYHPLAAADRGAVDVPLSGHHDAVQLRLQRMLGAVETTLTLRHFRDERVNGTVGQRNATRLALGALTLRGTAHADRDWQLTLYAQEQALRSTFSAVAPDRASETPANDQFDVPADAVGAALTWEWRDDGGSTTAGTDVRRVRGETRERFLFSGGEFTRLRIAGGTQSFAGAFVAREQRLAADWRGSLSVRADGWRLTDGSRHETNLLSGATTRQELYADRSRATWSATAGVVWQPRPAWRARAAAYRAFRLPTLNEFHRPFRVGNVNTEANPSLRHETLLGAEVGADFSTDRVTIRLTAFANRLEDAVGNVTLATTPTLVSRERQNLERVDVHGAEARITWTPHERFAFNAAWLWSEAEVARASQQPALVGRRLAQAPRHVATAGAQVSLGRGWALRAQGRWTDRQFEDDENTLVLGAAVVTDARLSGPIGEHTTLTISGENLTDTAVPVARGAGGLTSYGAPRTIRAAVRFDW